VLHDESGYGNTDFSYQISLYPKYHNALCLRSGGIFLVYSLVKRKPKHLIASLVWMIIVVWFFNSPFFGFSAVSVSSEGIRLNYGVLSLRNDLLPIDSQWKVETHLSGLRKMKKLYLIRIADHESMKVRRDVGLGLLEKIGGTIEDMKAQKLGDRRGLSRLRHPQEDTIG